jgi:hypothetical protein
VEYQHAWALTGFGDADSGNENDAADANTYAEVTDGEISILTDADETASASSQDGQATPDEPNEISVQDDQDTAGVHGESGETPETIPTPADHNPSSMISGKVRMIRPGLVAAAHWAARRSNAVLAAFILVVCMVALLIAAAWQSAKSPASANAANTSRSSTALGPVLDPADLGSGPNGSDGATSAPGASGSGSAQQPATGSGSPSAGAGASGGATSGQSNGASPAPARTPTTPGAYQVASFRIIGLERKCIGAAGGSSSSGTAVDLYPCQGYTTQQWASFSDGTLRTAGKCMEAAGGGTADGTRVQLSDCSGAAAQLWYYSAGQDLVNRNSDKCLDLKGMSSADLTTTQLWTCSGTSNQKWTLG